MSATENAAAHPSAAATLQIGEVARRVGLSIRTIRHWEEMRLVTPTARSSGGFRLYSEEDVSRIRLLRFMKPLNLSLAQMRELLHIREQLASGTESPSDRVEALVWPRTSDAGDDRAQLADGLSAFADLADKRLQKLRRYVEEVEEFVGRLREEVREGAGCGPASGTREGADPVEGGA
ncbi:MerR family transcriptional regulator [Pseudonocardia sp. KRD-184]|uniref:MerR family transcriptional regulator n=1 Tax=Pseudonocardia oceani TaxID=2792013 RepID=A0ABS6U5E7_9PSEU|nr:MerR family transcriptional regulator [Pseudonocardia oceani]MBW0091367.1 MerR family transcriptional regulator [Pseudonocardia oceani]MBW0098269.1 MerR family transcriptional regulator [Pseudonocardia oceani]MBW0124843.1 MerR family transcriptional regulator [Pseudonocardia oceani]MBW0127445.1 MerR family transcriptional regulator [Pseudonocardia oceani]